MCVCVCMCACVCECVCELVSEFVCVVPNYTSGIQFPMEVH